MGRSLPKGCQIVTEYTGDPNELEYEILCDGKRSRNGSRFGRIELMRQKVGKRVVWFVDNVEVGTAYRRRGFATKLYEAAAKAACDRGAPLASTARVTPGSQGFWNKQLKKGRASVLRKSTSRDSDVVALRCPAPRDLSGRRRR